MQPLGSHILRFPVFSGYHRATRGAGAPPPLFALHRSFRLHHSVSAGFAVTSPSSLSASVFAFSYAVTSRRDKSHEIASPGTRFAMTCVVPTGLPSTAAGGQTRGVTHLIGTCQGTKKIIAGFFLLLFIPDIKSLVAPLTSIVWYQPWLHQSPIRIKAISSAPVTFRDPENLRYRTVSICIVQI